MFYFYFISFYINFLIIFLPYPINRWHAGTLQNVLRPDSFPLAALKFAKTTNYPRHVYEYWVHPIIVPSVDLWLVYPLLNPQLS